MSPSVADIRTRKTPATSIMIMTKMATTETMPRSSPNGRHSARMLEPPIKDSEA